MTDKFLKSDRDAESMFIVMRSIDSTLKTVTGLMYLDDKKVNLDRARRRLDYPPSCLILSSIFLELSLKILCRLELGDHPKDHDALGAYKKLDPSTQAELKEIYDRRVSELEGLEIWKDYVEYDMPDDLKIAEFEDVLRENEGVMKNFKYDYEFPNLAYPITNVLWSKDTFSIFPENGQIESFVSSVFSYVESRIWRRDVEILAAQYHVEKSP